MTKILPSEIETAKMNPGGWVYRIAGTFDISDRIPPEAIVGAWKVDEKGEIIGQFVPNENYHPEQYPF